MTITELLIPPSPVDWRLYDHEVQMGWKTSEEIQTLAEKELGDLAQFHLGHTDPREPAIVSFVTTHAKKYLGLSKLPGLVETLTSELKADREKKVVLFFETRDVGMALRESLKPYKPILLFKGTPDSQRAKRLKDFAKPWSRVAICQLQAAPWINLMLGMELVFVELSADPTLIFPLAHLPLPKRLVLLAGTVDEALMRARWQATEQLLEGVTV